MCQEKNIIYFINTVQQNCKLYQHVAIPIPCQLVGMQPEVLQIRELAQFRGNTSRQLVVLQLKVRLERLRSYLP